jgi:hypothetical protein
LKICVEQGVEERHGAQPLSPRFNLLSLGKRDERIVLRTVLRSPSKQVTVFTNYVVGRKEAQLAIQPLEDLNEVDVESVTRYRIRDLGRDVTRYFKASGEMESN